jgi:hypothetical protein
VQRFLPQLGVQRKGLAQLSFVSPNGVDIRALRSTPNPQCAAPSMSTILHAANAPAHRGILLELKTATIVANDQVYSIGNESAVDKSLGSFSVAMNVA